MNITDENLSRWIAEKLESFESLPDPEVGQYASKCWRVANRGHVPFKEKGIAFYGEADMVNDPAVTVMLIERLRCMWMTLTVSKHGVKVSIRTKRIPLGHRGARHVIVYSEGERLGRAVAEAFALANGWTEESK